MSITIKKNEDFSNWFTQILTKAKLIEYYDVSGCYVLLPNSYSIWEKIQYFLDKELKRIDVQNTYFPLFITKKNLEIEQSHIEGFKPEVAWVTKSGLNDLVEPIAIRPTSECAIYSILPKLIKSYNDLPLKINQWCNVVRWEISDTTPFIRSKEFLWSETHSSYSNEKNGIDDALYILDIYKNIYKQILATPVIKGRKTKNEKFAGAIDSYSIESFIPQNGKGIQAATCHNLGQNFSKMFGIIFQDKDQINKYVWQISCGITTRSIGIMLMLHGDDKGPIIPPLVSSIQIVIIPIIFKNKEELVLENCKQIFEKLKDQFRIKLDERNHKPGWKYNYWETMGVPLRIEIGPKDISNKKITLCKRNKNDKITVDNDELVIDNINKIFAEINNELYEKANVDLIKSIEEPNDEQSFEIAISNNKICFINWCETDECENYIKEKFKAKSLCIPYEIKIKNLTDFCPICNKKSTNQVLFSKSY